MKDVNAATTTLPARRAAHERVPSFASVAEQHLDDVFRYLLVFTRDPSLAEDLAGETFERSLRAWRRFDPRRSSPRTWLCAIARNAALDHFRTESRRRRREQLAADEQRDVDPPELGLSPELERALRIVLELDPEATARLLRISPTACTTRLNRALQRLEERMTDDE